MLCMDLVLVEELRVESDIARFVDTVDVTKGSSNAKVGALLTVNGDERRMREQRIGTHEKAS